MLIKELRNLQKEDQSRRERLGNVRKQITKLDEEKNKSGRRTREKLDRRAELYYEYLRLNAELSSSHIRMQSVLFGILILCTVR